MAGIEEITGEYKHDAYGNPLFAQVFCPDEKPATALPIAAGATQSHLNAH